MAKNVFRKLQQEAQTVWTESFVGSNTELSKLQKFGHFCVMVWRSFTRNRCPVRASALAYGSLLALIPMLAVVMSITSTFLKKEGEDQIDHFIVKIVASLTPPAMVSTNSVPHTNTVVETDAQQGDFESFGIATNENLSPPQTVAANPGGTNSIISSLSQDEKAVRARKAVARNIHQFIQNTRSGTLGLTGSIALIFVAISMLTRIEDTFNDIWGVAHGRSWFTRIMLYWGVLSLAPLLIIVAVTLASGPHLQSTRHVIQAMPHFATFIFQFMLPLVVVWFTFTLFYLLMPNTKVRWRAALVGGLVGGSLFHLNNVVSVLYVSRVITYSKIYGSLGLVPVFMVGLYLGWLILLFGSQVAYAYQNRASYLEERQVEHINQRGREFIALRLMTCVGERFVRGEPPPGVIEIGKNLCIPTKLVQQIMHTLCASRLVVEASGSEPAYLPARPLDKITCHDLLLAMRATHGNELATRDEPSRHEVFGEFHRIEEAERKAADCINMLALVHRSIEKQIQAPPQEKT
jgi:membrane protein